MFRSGLLVVFILICSSGFSQSFPFPDSAATWVRGFYSIVFTPPDPLPDVVLTDVTNFCVNGEDTVINAELYSKMYICNAGYKGAVRDDNGKVFFVPVDSLQEFLLYDFTLNVGDTAQIYYETDWDDGVVETIQVASVNYDPDLDNRKILSVEPFGGGGGPNWIEGIGSEWGLFTEPWYNVSNWAWALECMSHFDTIRYPYWNAAPGICDLTLNTIQQAPTSELSIFPNPASDLAWIDHEHALRIQNVEIFSIDGRTFRIPFQTSNGRIELDLEALPSGPYVVVIRTEGSVQHLRVIRN